MISRVIVAGGRDFIDYALMERTLDRLIYHKCLRREVEIVSGCARGADTLAIQWARSRGFPVKRFPADWDKYGRGAGSLRNIEMAEYGTHLIAFWDGKSRGTAHMIRTATEHGLKVRVIRYSVGVIKRREE